MCQIQRNRLKWAGAHNNLFFHAAPKDLYVMPLTGNQQYGWMVSDTPKPWTKINRFPRRNSDVSKWVTRITKSQFYLLVFCVSLNSFKLCFCRFVEQMLMTDRTFCPFWWRHVSFEKCLKINQEEMHILALCAKLASVDIPLDWKTPLYELRNNAYLTHLWFQRMKKVLPLLIPILW